MAFDQVQESWRDSGRDRATYGAPAEVGLSYVNPVRSWMPGKDAINHVRRAHKCSEADAISMLRGAIAERAVAARLPDPQNAALRAPFPPSPLGSEKDCSRQTPDSKMWENAEIRSDGTVRLLGRWYAFTVLREEVFRKWPEEAAYLTGVADRAASRPAPRLS
jgi:hypothetical protein